MWLHWLLARLCIYICIYKYTLPPKRGPENEEVVEGKFVFGFDLFCFWLFFQGEVFVFWFGFVFVFFGGGFDFYFIFLLLNEPTALEMKFVFRWLANKNLILIFFFSFRSFLRVLLVNIIFFKINTSWIEFHDHKFTTGLYTSRYFTTFSSCRQGMRLCRLKSDSEGWDP